MQRTHVLLLTLVLASPALARAQAPIEAVRAELAQLTLATNPAPSVDVDSVLARIMTFDRDLDRRVTTGELPERMHGVVARGDTDGDAAVDATEIRRLAQAPPEQVFVEGIPFGVYGFADDFSLSFRSHVEGAIADLGLDASRRMQTQAAAMTLIDMHEAEARAALLKEMETVLVPARLPQFTASLDKAMSRIRTSQVFRGAHVHLSGVIAEYALSGEQRIAAFEALKQFNANLSTGDAERSALIDRVSGILSDQERDDLRAALDRRPVVRREAGISLQLTGTLAERLRTAAARIVER